MTSASDQRIEAWAGSASVGVFAGSGAAADALFFWPCRQPLSTGIGLWPSPPRAGSLAGVMADGLVRQGRARLRARPPASGPRPSRQRAGMRGRPARPRASGTGLAGTTSMATPAGSRVAAPIVETAPSGQERQGGEAQDRERPTRLVDAETTDLDRSVSIRAACVMLYSKNSERLRVPRTMGGSCGRTMMYRASPWRPARPPACHRPRRHDRLSWGSG